MKVSYVETDAPIGKDFRGNLKDSQQLLIGEDDTPDNYRLGFSRQQGPFFSPRHKHNFDQIRMILGGGGMSYGPDQWIQPGELVYVRVTGRSPAGEEIVRGEPGESATMAAEAMAGLIQLIARYDDEAQPYRSRTAPRFVKTYPGDYDHLARVREWSTGDDEEESG